MFLKKTAQFISVILVLVLSECTPPCKFIFNQLYLQKDFTGRDIYRKTIEICPVLFENGPDTTSFAEQNLLEILKKTKPKIIINKKNRLKDIFCRHCDITMLENFYKKLYESDMISLQTSDSIWSRVESDYLLVVYVRGGYTLQVLGSRVLKKIIVETELWDCHGMEVVWRGAAENTCVNEKKSDFKLFFKTVEKIFLELPSPIPSYDKKNW